jgi:hypothetical protein
MLLNTELGRNVHSHLLSAEVFYRAHMWKMSKPHCVKPFYLTVFLIASSWNFCPWVVVTKTISEKFSKWKMNLKEQDWGSEFFCLPFLKGRFSVH